MPLVVCPTCRKKFDPQATRAMPFCSDRCRQIDLGRWLNEDQRLPIDPPEEEEADDRPFRRSEDDDES